MAADFRLKTLHPRNPASKPKVDVVFPAHYTKRLYETRRIAYMNLVAAKYVLEHPARIFWGLRAYNEGGWGCYTGRPPEWCLEMIGAHEMRLEPLHENIVFAVYVSSASEHVISELRVYECRAEYAAQDDALCPVNWQSRYKNMVKTA